MGLDVGECARRADRDALAPEQRAVDNLAAMSPVKRSPKSMQNRCAFVPLRAARRETQLIGVSSE
jgi:hypothetical protein